MEKERGCSPEGLSGRLVDSRNGKPEGVWRHRLQRRRLLLGAGTVDDCQEWLSKELLVVCPTTSPPPSRVHHVGSNGHPWKSTRTLFQSFV